MQKWEDRRVYQRRTRSRSTEDNFRDRRASERLYALQKQIKFLIEEAEEVLGQSFRPIDLETGQKKSE